MCVCVCVCTLHVPLCPSISQLPTEGVCKSRFHVSGTDRGPCIHVQACTYMYRYMYIQYMYIVCTVHHRFGYRTDPIGERTASLLSKRACSNSGQLVWWVNRAVRCVAVRQSHRTITGAVTVRAIAHKSN